MRDYISPEKRLILDFFYEIECPFCRRVRINIIDKLRMKHIVTINSIDVDANTGSIEMSWYNSFYKEFFDSPPAPLLRLHENYLDDSSWNYVFLMWKKKPTSITEEILKAEEILEKQLYDKIREYQNTIIIPVQPSYELDKQMFFTTINKLKIDDKSVAPIRLWQG